MTKKNKKEQLKEKSRFAAMEGLRPTGILPVPPRKAMSEAKKASKKLRYPLPPYPSANPLKAFRWAQHEWWRLGRWQSVAAPVMVVVALLTWEKERALKEARWDEIEHAETKQMAANVYGAYGRPTKKRKLLGIIPLPGRK